MYLSVRGWGFYADVSQVKAFLMFQLSSNFFKISILIKWQKVAIKVNWNKEKGINESQVGRKRYMRMYKEAQNMDEITSTNI